MPRPKTVYSVSRCGEVKCSPERVHGFRVFVTRRSVVEVERTPWGEVRVVTWCPVEWSSCGDWPQIWAELQLRSPMKKRDKNAESKPGRAASDEELRASHPELYDYLTCLYFDGDTSQPRATSTLLVFCQDGVWKGCLRDRAEGVCAWVAAPSFQCLLDVLDKELAGGTAVWRLDRASGAPEASRRPRPKGT